MSGIVSGITKAFTAVGSAVARVGSAVASVGASVFTAGAATGAGSIASGGMGKVASNFGSSALGRVLTGAIGQAAVGAVLGGGISALTGNGFGKGALMGGLGGAVTGGLTGLMAGAPAAAATTTATGLLPASTPTGLAPTGVTQSVDLSSRLGDGTAIVQGRGGIAAGLNQQQAALTSGLMPGGATPPAAGGGLGSFLNSEMGGNILKGVGDAYTAYDASRLKEKQLDMQAEEYDAERASDLDREMRIRNSYKMTPAAYESAVPTDTTVRPTPAQAYTRTRMEYDPAQGRIVAVPA